MSDKIIDQIEQVRTSNNVNWMDILRIAYRSNPEDTKKVLARINADDKKISNLLLMLAGEHADSGT